MSTNKLELSGKTSKKITPDMVGLFFEDINFAADGGLYAEMIENRSFEAVKSCGENHNYVLQEDNLYAWASTDKQPKNLIISFNQPVSQNNPHWPSFFYTCRSLPHSPRYSKKHPGYCNHIS